MNPAPNREVALFSAALELPAGERAVYLAENCADDPALRLRLEALLRVHQDAISFLENQTSGAPESPLVVEVRGALRHLSTSPAEKAGDRIGRYKLLQQIGEGGCGVVYMAEQEEPVRRRVALKVIKLGMDTKQVIARFEAERQALALMDHPNIAKVLDAGATDTGRPYFVMELVRGVKITDYCDEQNLSTQERLKLFTQVCQAIQHAHQKGVIHRDIKPSNILVTVSEPGAPGCPKVIDFGIAKATTGQRLTDKTFFTAFEQFIGTPAYMSPEQAMMTSLDIDTRTDIYALGVLLYELLTGQTPFDAKELMAAGLDAMRRIIREQEPARPSTRLSTMLAGELTTTAKHRQTDPPKLVHLLRGDLDWIVMKALEKERSRRYETANGLARDVERFLANEPVAACPPSNLYRLRKLVRRNKGVFVAISAVAAALVIGLGLSTWLLFLEKAARQRAVAAEQQANQARASEAAQRRQADDARANEAKLRVKAQDDEKKAQTEAGKSKQVVGLFKKMLQGVGPSKARGRDTTMLREILDKAAEGVGAELTNQAEVEVEMRLELAETYGQLGLLDKREAMARESLRVACSGLGEEHQCVADSLSALADSLWSLGRFAEAETTYRETLALQRKLHGDEHPDVGTTLHCLADALNYQGRLAEAETTLRQAVAIRTKQLGKESPGAIASLCSLGHVLWQQGKLTDLDGLVGDALPVWRKLREADNPQAARALFYLGQLRSDQDKQEEAEAILRDALAIQRKHLGEDLDVANSLNELGSVLRAAGKLDQAESAFREAMDMQRKLLGPEHPESESLLYNVASVLRQEGKLGELETLYRDSLARQRKGLGDESPEAADTLDQLAAVLVDEGKGSEAEALWRGELTPALARFNGRAHDDPKRAGLAIKLGHIQCRLAGVLAKTGRSGQAELLLREALGVFKQAASDFPDQPFLRQEQADTRRQLGEALVTLGRVEEAESEVRAAIALYAGLKAAAPTNWAYGQEEAATASLLARMLEESGRSAAAGTAYREAIVLSQALTTASPDRRTFRIQLAELLCQHGTFAGVEGAYRLAAEQYRKLAEGGDPEFLNALAWLLATCPDSSVRDGQRALDLAKRAVAASNRKEENYLDTLAAACAATGQFEEAARTEKEAIKLLPADDRQRQKEFASHLKLYESGLPYRQSAQETANPR